MGLLKNDTISQKKLARQKDLYERPLVRPEGTGKDLPLERILQQNVTCFPETNSNLDFDIVEIGPGNGDFLFFLAEQHPTKKILGIEIGRLRFEKLKARLVKQDLQNVTLIFGDARIPFYKHLKPSSIEKCFILFPDPWPRNRHRHLRLLQKEFLEKIRDALKPGGELTLATDVEDYARWTFDNLNLISGMENALGENQMTQTLPDIIPTFFQKKWQALGRKSWCVRFVKM